jgi:Helix-turn-helix domain
VTDFNSKDADMWPLWLTLQEVALVLRYKDVGTVRLLTDKAVSLGGLPYRKEGRRRMVSKADLLAYMNRPAENSKVRAPAPRKPTRKPSTLTRRKSFLAMIGRAA